MGARWLNGWLVDMSVTYALGVFFMLHDALRQHIRLHYGAKPRRFVLHPTVVCELLANITPSQRCYIDFDQPSGNYRFMGIEIVADSRAERAKLVDVNNVVAYL